MTKLARLRRKFLTADNVLVLFYGIIAGMLISTLLVALSVRAQINAGAAEPKPEVTTSSCWHPPYLIDQPSELTCSLRLP